MPARRRLRRRTTWLRAPRARHVAATWRSRGSIELRRAVESGADGALRDFYAAAVALVRDRAAAWPEIVREAPLREAEAGLARATAVATGDGRHLSEGRIFEAAAAAGAKSFGMCGRLTTYDLTLKCNFRVASQTRMCNSRVA